MMQSRCSGLSQRALSVRAHAVRHLRAVALSGATLLALICGLIVPALFARVAHAAGPQYYVNCSAATNGDGSQVSPWNSLASVNTHGAFQAGDAIYFYGGVTCTGELAPQGSGGPNASIVIGSYGPPGFSRGIISGGGVQPAAIYLDNQQYWDINGIEVSNAVNNAADRAGIRVDNSTGGMLTHIHILNDNVHDVAGYVNGYYGDNGGIVVNSIGTGGGSQWNDVLIENNTVTTIYRVGIFVGQDTADHTDAGASVAESTNVVIQNNIVTASGGDGIIAYRTDGALIQNNVVSNSGASVNSACQTSEYCNPAAVGIWTVSGDNTVVQFNEVYGQSGGSDGYGYDCDFASRNAIFQYNYSHDNYGGFMLVLTKDSVNPIVRYNVSQNDHRYTFKFDTPLDGNGDFGSGAAQIYNNSIYTSAATGNVDFTGLYNSSHLPAVAFTNNIVDRQGGGGYSSASNGSDSYTSNIFFGNASYPSGTGTITSDPLFANPGGSGTGISTASAYQLQSGSPALGAGVNVNNAGSRDYFGNPIASPPNIGAYQGAGVAGSSISGQHKVQLVNNSATLDVQIAGYNYTPCNCGAYDIAVTPDSWNDGVQTWTFVPVGGNQYKLQMNWNGGLYDLQLAGDNYTPCNCGAHNVVASPDAWNLPQQVWTLINVSGNQYKLQMQFNGSPFDLQFTGNNYTPCNCGAYDAAATPDSWGLSAQVWNIV